MATQGAVDKRLPAGFLLRWLLHHVAVQALLCPGFALWILGCFGIVPGCGFAVRFLLSKPTSQPALVSVQGMDFNIHRWGATVWLKPQAQL
jgi:hypothetical protein